MKLTLGFSPMPADTFIFDALVNRKIDTMGIEFEPVIEKPEILDEWAAQGKLDITRIGMGICLTIKEYFVLTAGATMVNGVGPILVTCPGGVTEEEVIDSPIAIPGEHSVGHILLLRAFPGSSKSVFMPAEAIEAAVLNKTVAAGIIPHEERFTCQKKGMVILGDLAARWNENTHSPVPLAITGLKWGFDLRLPDKLNMLIGKSVEYARARYPEIPEFTKQHAVGMSEEQIRQHINWYVNEYTANMGDAGDGAFKVYKSAYHFYHDVLKPEREGRRKK